MGLAFRVKPTKECWNESLAVNASPRAAKTKEKPAGRGGGFSRCSCRRGCQLRRAPYCNIQTYTTTQRTINRATTHRQRDHDSSVMWVALLSTAT
jgi:hypothetical protein